jgi:predicted CXXCH cytochrome family protein
MIAVMLAATAQVLLAASVQVLPGAAVQVLPGANGPACLACHEPVRQALAKPFVHEPVRKLDCTACHDPHASKHGKLLKADCASCHATLIPAGAKSVHEPARTGACISCHDPHSSDTKFELKTAGVAGCASCHAAVTDAWKRARHKHTAACTACHDPHASKTAQKLLASEEPLLCLSCHKLDKAQHRGLPVQKAKCSGCHDPHGSDQPAMLLATVHKPVANRQCAECHVEGSLAVRDGVGCATCHAQQIARMTDRPQVHPALVEDKACLNCHSPHASRERALVRGNLVQVCGACHADTIARQQLSPTKHKPVLEGNCSACHDPHSSDVALLLKRADDVQLCGTCHDWQKHSTHPIGPKLVDPRNRNLTLDCLSCHRAHGTEFKHMNPYPTTTELCTKCHQDFRR